MHPQDPELTQLLGRYIPVRITNFKNVDMNQFRFDYDLTFAVLMMSPDGTVQARYGTQDWTKSTSRMSIPGLKNAMSAVLAAYHPKSGTAPASQPRRTLQDIPAFSKSKQASAACAHCHFANNYRFADLMAKGEFRKSMLFQYPLPENIGVALELDRNNVVRSVLPDSPAQKAGVQPGDVITRAESTPVFSSADLQFALDPLPEPGQVKLELTRAGKKLAPLTLQLPAGWRRTDISWRPSMDGVPPQIGFWGEPLNAAQKKAVGVAPDRLALRASFLFPGAQWAKTRGDLKQNDVIVGLDGKELPEMNTRQFHAHVRLTYSVGDAITLNVLRAGKPLEIRVTGMDVREE